MICVLHLIASKEGMMDVHSQSCLPLIPGFIWVTRSQCRDCSFGSYVVKDRGGEMQLEPAKPELS